MRISTKQIIGEAWEFTQDNKKLILWYAFIPSLLTTLVGMLYLAYQYFNFLSSPLFENWDQSLFILVVSTVITIIRDNFSTSIPFLVTVVVIGIFYILIPSFSEGAIIQLIARKRNGHPVKTWDGIRYGLLSFLPLFEYSWFVRTFSYVSVITGSAWVMRNLGMNVFYTFLPLFIFVAIVGIILTLLFIYAEFFIVIDDSKVFESISKSATLVVNHLEETILLAILMLIISIRILIQIVFVLLIPVVVLTIAYALASSALPAIAIGIAGVIGLILLYIASYLNGIIHVFAASVWTFTFLELTSEEFPSAREKLDSKE